MNESNRQRKVAQIIQEDFTELFVKTRFREQTKFSNHRF